MTRHTDPSLLPPFTARVVPHALQAAHDAMVSKLAAIKPPRIYLDPDPDDFEAAAGYVADVARIMDEWHRAVGQEVASNAPAGLVFAPVFQDAFRGATEGMSIFEITRAAEALKEERAA